MLLFEGEGTEGVEFVGDKVVLEILLFVVLFVVLAVVLLVLLVVVLVVVLSFSITESTIGNIDIFYKPLVPFVAFTEYNNMAD